jgi:hypothetical protein
MEKSKSPVLVPAEGPLKDFEYVDFDVMKENWNKHRLEDGTILKSKFVLISVMAEKGYKEKMRKAEKEKGVGVHYEFLSSNLVGAEVPEKLMGLPETQKFTPEELVSSVVLDDMDFETVAESWNAYQLEKIGLLKVRASPVRVRRSGKLDDHGRPIYLVDFNADIKILPKGQ